MVMPMVNKQGEAPAVPDMQAQITFGRKALHELRLMVRNRPDKLVINGKQYLEFSDWQMLGAFFGITAYVVKTEEITKARPIDGVPGMTVLDVIGFKARAEARRYDGSVLSAADAECLREEKNWQGKARFQVLSMAETRACSKVLRQCLQWVVKLPDDKGVPPTDIGETAAEEVEL